jgi:hypothetical protein
MNPPASVPATPPSTRSRSRRAKDNSRVQPGVSYAMSLSTSPEDGKVSKTKSAQESGARRRSRRETTTNKNRKIATEEIDLSDKSASARTNLDSTSTETNWLGNELEN